MNRIKILNAWHLKLLMSILMALDHLRIIHNLISPEAANLFSVISRCAAPVFAYLAVEGIRHTRNIKKYCLRLSVLAGIVFLGNAVLNRIFKSFSETVPETEQKYLYISNNVIFTLAIGVLVIALIIHAENKGKKAGFFFLAAVCGVIGMLWGEWGSVLLPFMVTVYIFREKRLFRFMGYAVTEVIALLLPFSEPLYFTAFPFIFLYNGKRGPNNRFTKYFFYVFYPLHIWVLAAINFILMVF